MIFRRGDGSAGSARAVSWLLMASCALAQGALADDVGSWALKLGLGANYGARAELEGPDVKVDYDLGLPRLKGSAAMRLGERWWLDLSLSQRKTKAEFSYPASGGLSSDVGSNDRYTSGSLMLSVMREFDLGPWLKPYVGFGAGPTWLTYRFGRSDPGGGGEELLINDDATAVAYQALLGFRFPLTRRLDLGLEYEYWRTPDVDLEDVSGSSVALDQTIHSGWVNLTWYPGSERDAVFGRARASGPSSRRGFYLTGNAGVNWLADTETGTVTFDAAAPGVLASVAVGHSIARRWRMELEYAYRNNTPQVVDFGRFCRRKAGRWGHEVFQSGSESASGPAAGGGDSADGRDRWRSNAGRLSGPVSGRHGLRRRLGDLRLFSDDRRIQRRAQPHARFPHRLAVLGDGQTPDLTHRRQRTGAVPGEQFG